jgi:hypothetical protein
MVQKKQEEAMSYKRRSEQTSWARRGVQFILALAVLAISIDYGKHLILKSLLENEIAASGGVVSVDSLKVSPWPLLDNHLILNNFHVNISGTPLQASQVTIRQGWKEWRMAHIEATDVKSSDTVTVENAQGTLDTADLRSRVKVSDLVLNGIKAKLPLVSFSGARATFDFLYEMSTQHLTLKADVPELAFSSGATFGLKGEGAIETKAPIHGNMDVKIKNIDKLMKELVAVKAVEASHAGMLTTGSNFLGNIGLHDITLPLKIEDGDVSLGPIPLFKVGKASH